ncbi:MAG TPA: DmsE family decaheme c-type cytochrome [Myxococcota bacterium]|nr:DmsE family decaheme c-type cytochrome [Myxococcota bacterium]
MSRGLGLLFGALLAAVSACRTQTPEAKPAEPEAAASGYVGDEACLACHESMKPGFSAKYGHTAHAHVLSAKNAQGALAAHGCEACHGPGEAHVSQGGGRGVGGFVPFGDDSPEATQRINTACMACHHGGDRTYWAGSAHQAADVACTKCHTLMESVSQTRLLAGPTEVETCARCHPAQYSRAFRNAHMPLRPGSFEVSTAAEGKMRCSSCHQPHGTVNPNLIRHVTVNDECLSCHGDKRGPFLWEHSPVVEDCLNCHDPHGSTRHAMLKMNVPRLCQTCHVSTGHATSPRNPNDRFAVATSCLQCHTQVHGSNHPSGFALTR